MPESQPNTQSPFIEVTRVYGKDDNIQTQPVLVHINQIESFRPRNTIGTKQTGNRCTLIMNSGKYINVKDKFSEVKRKVNEALSN